MKINNDHKIGFYVYSYYQARDILSITKNYKISPYITFKYYIINNLGISWIKEISKLLIKDFNKNEFKIIIDCSKNPALAINCIR